MTTTRLLAALLVGMMAAVSFARARRPADDAPGTESFAVQGVVTAQAQGSMTVAHDAIPGYMPAMTMPFTLGDAAPALAPGDRVRFTLRVAAEGATAEAITIVGSEPAIARAVTAAGARGVGRLKRGDGLPAFSLIAQDGRRFTAGDLRRGRTAVTFIFTRCPMPEFCPLMVKRFQQIQRELKSDPSLRDARLVSVTLDPEFDTPPVLAAYAKAMGADADRWQFLTGEPDQIARLAGAFSIHVARQGVFLDHTLATAVVDADGRLVEIWRGNGWSARDVLEVLRREEPPASR